MNELRRLTAASASQTPSQPRSRHNRVVFTLGLVFVLFASMTLGACETVSADRSAVIDNVNATRAQNGVGALSENAALNIKADAWAAKMRDSCTIFHSTLSDGAPGNWRKLGENVGRGGDIEAVHAAYLKSPGHFANIVDPAFTSMGAGAVWGTCNGSRTLFTAQVFMKS
jgi:uncharacterized protein YkwD